MPMAGHAGKFDNLCDAALDYLRCGWPIVVMQGKEPAHGFLPRGGDANPTVRPMSAEDVTGAYQRDPSLWFATICGPATGVCLDVDRRNGGHQAIRGKHLSLTPTERTPDGWHYWYRHPGIPVPYKSELGPGIELLGDGHLVVVAPCGGREWAIDPDEVDLTPLPSWVLESLPATDTSNYIITSPTAPDPQGPVDSPPMRPDYSYLSHPGPKTLGTLRGDQLMAWFDRPYVGITIARRMGLRVDGLERRGRGKVFRCILPGHEERKPSASLFQHRSGGILYRDWHAASGENWYTLPDVAASLAYGEAIVLRGPERATWSLRLLVESGFIGPARVDLVELPADAPEAARKVYEGLGLLLGSKWLHTPYEPTPCSWRFGAAWCGTSKSTVERGMTWLLSRGYVRKVDEVRASYGRTMGLFLPGTRQDVERRWNR